MKRLLLLALVASACEAPPVFPGADRRQNTALARIEGDVVAATTARGDAVLFLYDADRPPPPQGTGHPLTFTVVPRAQLFAGAADGAGGPFTAPYAFSLVPPGRYLVQGFVDANADFVPWYSVTAGTNLGDVGGAAVDALTLAPRVIEVGLGADGLPAAATGVPVSVSDAARFPVDRPVFQAAGGATSLVLSGASAAVELDAFPLDEGAVHEGHPAFLAQLVDANGDGVPDDSNGDGVPDFWPRVVVRKLEADASPLVDENDVDKNGVLDATGADYAHRDPSTGAVVPPDGQPDLVVLAAGFDFSSLLPQLLEPDGGVKATPTPVAKLTLVVKALALDARDPAHPAPLAELPPGRYAVTLIQSTGQTWRVPNELAPGLAPGSGLPERASQAFVVRVP